MGATTRRRTMRIAPLIQSGSVDHSRGMAMGTAKSKATMAKKRGLPLSAPREE